jgi:hypothetical protein
MSENDVVGSDSAVLAGTEDSKAAKKPTARAMPKWEAEADCQW